MKINPAQPIAFTIEVALGELKLLRNAMGNTSRSDDEDAGVSHGTGYLIYQELTKALGEISA